MIILMEISSPKSFVAEFLSFLEQRETRLLSWGFYDVSFDPAEVDFMVQQEADPDLASYWESLKEDGWTIESLLDDMEHGGLLYRVSTDEDVYRTRFAEGVRLLARLRQMFKPQDWSTGPSLVSDIKIQLSPRRYPRRDQTADECWRDLEALCWQKELQRAVFDELSLGRDGLRLHFSKFQRNAFKHVLGRYRGRGLSGSVVSAGTGSGKTKAFYIPAFLGAVTELPPQHKPFTKIVAIYPRNVLLADQLREALSEASKIRPVLERFGLRPLTFGALLGATPEEQKFILDDRGKYPVEKIGWRRAGSSFVVPFLKSPQSPDQDLVWRDEDRQRGVTALYRAAGDKREPDVPDGTLILTREQLKTQPPDILFLSAEMLNREMGNPEWAATFGIGQGLHSPRLILLDEVHAYEGVSGAQIAWVLRRWRYWSGARNLHFVGLSATLKEATKHLGLVTGVSSSSIQEFTPAERELDMRDVEYNLAVKGDPASGASLLATSIQTGMLLTRLLTPRNVPPPDGDDIRGSAFYGRKVFGFTDNLDGLNRWYSDLSDAEGNLRLARLRLHPQRRQPPVNLPAPVVRAMDEDGQVWELPRRLGYNLSQSLNVSRCSSQDPGANAGSDVIVASASLEVGFDDPEVGAVLHHKKPVSTSSFIQRKGRAGRRVGTRPWTVVVLSDYGGDRWAFQNAERLFQPEIESIFLPISNPYVLRIQATYFLVDWIGRRVGQGSPFRYLSYYQHGPARRVLEILEDFVRLGPEWQIFRRDFARAFSRPYGPGGRTLTEAELDSVLWHAPRPLLRHVVPTLLRKVQAHWRYADPELTGKYEDRGANRPLPQYLPGATFSDLGGTGVRLIFPPQEEKDDEQLSVTRALFETCPGRVSKRYALRVGEEGYWLAFSDQLRQRAGHTTAPVRELFPDRIFLENVAGVLVYQPQAAELQHRPPEVLDTSNAFWNWANRLRPISAGTALPVFIGSTWGGIVEHCAAHLHRDHSGVEVIRYASACEYELRLQRGRSLRGSLALASAGDDGRVVDEALGFRLHADGISLRVKGEHVRNHADFDAGRTSRFRPEYFLDQMKSCAELSALMNSFLVEWVWQTSLAMLSATALKQKCSIERAQQLLKDKRAQAARRVLDSIFQVRDVGVAAGESEARLKERIIEQWSDPAVVQLVEQLEATLWEDLGETYQEWVRRRYLATLAQAFRSAAVSRLNEVSEDDLMVDVSFGEDGDAEIYLTETNSGGLGQIEVVVQELRQSPELLLDGIRHALSYCPRKFIANNVTAVLGRIAAGVESDPIAAAFAAARSAKGFQQLAEAKRELQATLDAVGFDSSRQVVVAIVTKLLRAGSSPRTDAAAHLLNGAWRRHEERLGVSIDPRVFAYLCVQYGPARRRLAQLFREISGGEDPSDSQLYAALQQFLLSGCEDSCPECLDHPNRFNDFGRPSRSLALDWLSLGVEEVSADEHPDEWVEMTRGVLLRHARVRVRVSSSRVSEVARALQGVLADEVETGFLLLPISIAGIERSGPTWSVTLQLRGATHGD